MSKVNYTKPIEGFFILPDVKLPSREEGKLYRVKVLENLTESKNEEGIIKYNIAALKEGNPLIPSLPDYYAILDAGKKDNDFMNFNQKKLVDYWINFHTGGEFNPKEQKDKIVHYGSTDLEYSILGNFNGKDDWAKNLNNERIFRGLTGKTNKQLNEISDKVNQTETYLFRWNNLSEKRKFVARFYVSSDWFNLYVSRNPLIRQPAFRVEVQEQ